MITPSEVKNDVFLKYELEIVRRNLSAFINNFGEPRIEREDAGKGFYVYYPSTAESYIQFCPDIDYLDGWLYGVVQGHVRGEFTKMRSIGILHFDEMNAPDGDPLEEDIVITSGLNRKELNDLAYKIAQAKEIADEVADAEDDDLVSIDTSLLAGFVVPDDWDDYGWNDKIYTICAHYSYTMGTFQIESAETAVAKVN